MGETGVRNVYMVLRWMSLLMLLPFAVPATAQQRQFDIAVISDGRSDRLAARRETYVDELLALTASEFDVRIHDYYGDWSRASLVAQFDVAYADPTIDMLLVTGFVANQIGTMRRAYPKPTFLPVVLDTGMLSQPPANLQSGIPNLNYLTVYEDFGEDLDALAEVVPFTKLAMVLDQALSDVIPSLKSASVALTRERGIELIEVTHDGVNHRLFDRIPADTEAVFVAGLPRMPAALFDQLIADINAAGIASYSFVGITDVERGLLMTSSESRDIDRQARLNALNMQAVMLGAPAAEQAISAPSRKRFTINMATARQLGLSPTFDVLNASRLLNERPTATGLQFGLVEVALEAANQNQDLLAQRFSVDAGFEDIDIARASLWPQLGLDASHVVRRESPAVETGLLPERSTDGGISLRQVIYADPVYANIDIQKSLQLEREAILQALRLDVIQAATSAYYTVLNAQEQLSVQNNNLDVTRRNLELARDRVELGSSSAADVYRWQAELARAQILVLDARSRVNQSWNRLNRLLHKPQNERLALRAATLGGPFVIGQQEFDDLISSPADYARFSEYLVNLAIAQAPEVGQVDAQIAAQQRDLVSRKRSFWLPEFSLGGQYTNNFSSTVAAGGALPSAAGLDDWNFGLQATLPLFTGGGRSAGVSRAELEVMQLETIRVSTIEKVEESVRLQLHQAQANYGRINLSREAATASDKNYALVADAYATGAVSIIQLLDAQDASLNANAESINSRYEFLITVMALQRSVGAFDYLLPDNEQAVLANALRSYMTEADK